MDHALQNRLQTEFRDAMYGNHFRSSTFMSAAQVMLGQCEWLEAYCADPARGWNVRRMIWSPPVFDGAEATVQQIYASDAYGLTFANAFLRVHDYQTAQPLLNYKLDDKDTGCLTDAAHYRDFGRAEGIAFNGDQIVLPVNGFITGDGVFGASSYATIRAAHALRQNFNAVAAQEKRDSVEQASKEISTIRLPQDINYKAVANNVIYGYFLESIKCLNRHIDIFEPDTWLIHYKTKFDTLEKKFDKNITAACKIMNIDRSRNPQDSGEISILYDMAQFEFLLFRYFHALILNHLKDNPRDVNSKKVRNGIQSCMGRMTRFLSIIGVDPAIHTDQIYIVDIDDERKRLFRDSGDLNNLAMKIAAYGRDHVLRPGKAPAEAQIPTPH